MMTSPAPTRRRAVTLLELVISIAIMAVLMGGIGSAMLLAGRAIPADDDRLVLTVNASLVLDRIAADLMYATKVDAVTATSVTITVPDRDDDAAEETISYTWGGTAGDPLVVQYNAETADNLIESVEDFAVSAETSGVETLQLHVELQPDADAASRVRTSFELLNRPES